MADPQKVEAGTRFNDVGDCEADGYWEWTGETVVYWTPTARVRSLSSLGELIERTRSGHMFLYHVPPGSPPTPDPRDAVIEAARKVVENAETASDSLPGGRDALLVCADVRVSAELLVALRAALGAAKAASPK